MAESNAAVWGIDIGQAGLKAIRLRYAAAAEQVIAVAFDYVPHPKILSQPDAIPDELIKQALQTFLSRNETRGDLLAISVPGQSALTRFIQLPPVESSKVGEIVKYEARQQIPFALEEVIWDYQTLGSGNEEGGYLLDAEVGLFAMKRDQVMQQLRPFTDARCEVELIQIAPLALYNFLCYDQLGMRLGVADADLASQYSIVLDMGADNTTLLVSNGTKIWIRNVPIGGNHFTRALTKEMKLTFAKAEHLKCNATKAPDPKAVFQALRPVFNDYVSEIQRSIGYFSSVNREAKIQRILGLGNGFKLAGLQKFLHQNLQYEVERVESFPGMVGDAVLSVPLFQENILTFAVPYGLALQGLKLTRIHTTLLPRELETARMIRRKKPWAVACAATLLAGLALSAMDTAHAKRSTALELWKKAEDKAKQVVSETTKAKGEFEAAEKKNKDIRDGGFKLVVPAEGRKYWLEIYKALNECLPRDENEEHIDTEDISKKNRLRIHSVLATRQDDLGNWFKGLPESAKQYLTDADKKAGPTGPGYVFTLTGLHFHHGLNPEDQQILYVQNTLLKNLNEWVFKHATTNGDPVPVGKIGISHPVIVMSNQREIEIQPNAERKGNAARPGWPTGVAGGPAMGPGMGLPGRPGKTTGKKGKKGAAEAEAEDALKPVKVLQTDFTLSFAWRETPELKRIDKDPPKKPETAPGAAGTTPAAGAPGTGAPAAGAPATGVPPTAASPPAAAASPPAAATPPAKK